MTPSQAAQLISLLGTGIDLLADVQGRLDVIIAGQVEANARLARIEAALAGRETAEIVDVRRPGGSHFNRPGRW